MHFLRKLTSWPFLRQVVLYGIFGASAAGVDFLLFLGLRQLGLSLLIANLISVNTGIAISFVCNAFLNFRRTDALLRRAAVFFCVGWLGLALSSLILTLGVSHWGMPEVWVKAASIVVVAAFQFTLNKLVTFRVAWGGGGVTAPGELASPADSGATLSIDGQAELADSTAQSATPGESADSGAARP
ncbi:MAG: GtrA family protein [Bifidobacteriaceae bacterium]|nr:GtrA family protein [Bifidobacteriaceae bacterium]